MTKTRTITRMLVALAVAGSGLFLVATPTSAQVDPPCDPEIYNCPPPPAGEFQLDLTLNLNTGPVGLAVRAQVCGFSGPNVPFNVHFRDVLIIQGLSGDGAAPPVRCSASQSFSNEEAIAILGGPVQAASATIMLVAAQQQNGFPLTWKVPNLPLGPYQVCASAPGHNSDCEPFTIIGAAGTGGGSLARTGITIALLLAIALGLIVGGRAIVETSRRRREDAEAASDDDEVLSGRR